jgi:hypothetical protein
MSKNLKKEGTNVHTTLLSYMPAAVRMLYDIHDSIEPDLEKIDKGELFLRYLPEEFKKKFNNDASKDFLQETTSLKNTLNKLEKEHDKLKLK